MHINRFNEKIEINWEDGSYTNEKLIIAEINRINNKIGTGFTQVYLGNEYYSIIDNNGKKSRMLNKNAVDLLEKSKEVESIFDLLNDTLITDIKDISKEDIDIKITCPGLKFNLENLSLIHFKLSFKFTTINNLLLVLTELKIGLLRYQVKLEDIPYQSQKISTNRDEDSFFSLHFQINRDIID